MLGTWDARSIATLLLSLCLFCSSLSCRAPEPPAGPPNLILIVLDTVRADTLRLATDPAQSKVLSALARKAVVFSNASSTFDYTPPSHHSIFTGYYDGMNTEYDRAENSLPYYLRKLGYLTVGVAANGNLSPRSMNAFKGFEIYANHLEELQADTRGFVKQRATQLRSLAKRYDLELTDFVIRNTLNDADWVLQRLRQLLPDRIDKPLFLFLNFMDAHSPYAPPEDFYDASRDPRRPSFYGDLRERPIPPWDSLVADEHRLAELRRKLALAGGLRWKISVDLTEEQLALYRRRYEAGVRYLDSRLTDLFDLLRERGLYDNSIVFITSDHGESFGEDDYLVHNLGNAGDLAATRHVPLMVIPQRKDVDGPVVIADEVSIADIKPTIDELLGIDFVHKDGRRYGTSLVRYLRDYSVPPRARTTVPFYSGQVEDMSEELKERLRALGYLNDGGQR